MGNAYKRSPKFLFKLLLIKSSFYIANFDRYFELVQAVAFRQAPLGKISSANWIALINFRCMLQLVDLIFQQLERKF